jgi:GNAT superfamily N-acetyltransferase
MFPCTHHQIVQCDNSPLLKDQSPSRKGWAIRKLAFTERDKVRDHLLRLTSEERRLRFFHAVDDRFIGTYSDTMFPLGGIVLGCFEKRILRAVGELRRINAPWALKAEVSISVEGALQHHGIGAELVRRLMESARNRSIRTVHFDFLLDNSPMQKIVRKLGAELRWCEGEFKADIIQPWPSFSSFAGEVCSDYAGLLKTWGPGINGAAEAISQPDPGDQTGGRWA